MLQPAVRFIVGLVLALALLTWAASLVVYRTTRGWFEKDVSLRAELAVRGARKSLVAHRREGEDDDLRAPLTELTRHERILATAACSKNLAQLSSAGDLPQQFDCRTVGVHVAESPDRWRSWMTVTTLPGGPVHVSATPLLDHDEPVGFVVLVHDLSFIERREHAVRLFLLSAFGLLAVSASVVTILVGRMGWREVSAGLERVLRGESQTRSSAL